MGLLGYFVAYGAMVLAARLLFTDVWHYPVRTAGVAMAPWPLTVLVVSVASVVSGRIIAAIADRGRGRRSGDGGGRRAVLRGGRAVVDRPGRRRERGNALRGGSCPG
ncbi:hypothetical protein ACFC0M_31885 [Streptomyces sp. NPDC056149]|uniref:hypothetical protein n=1 Tax=Streptomyces sp. NPDC056149 TaxID=3345728 RepID=UPI0035E17A78